MLRVIQTKAAAAAKSYYSRSDYLSEGQELVGRWGGKGSRMLGLAGEVLKQDFDRLCDNLDPRTGRRLTLRQKSNRTVGYDFNFHAPKGVSLAYLVGNDDRILDAFRESVAETMDEIEADASTRVRKHGRMEERPTANLVHAGFVHFTTREVDGEVDPHLHAHQLVFNVTRDEKEHAWKAVQFRELKRDASYFEAAFHARFSARIRGLGYSIERHGRDWDLAQINCQTKGKFSRRTAEIEQLADELGIQTDKEKDGLGAKTRQTKSYGTSLGELKDAWRERLDEAEANTLDALPSLDVVEPSAMRDADAEQTAMCFAREHCFERDSVVPARKVLTEALRHGLGSVSVDGIQAQLNEQQVITRSMDGRLWATTPEVLNEERAMIDRARSGKGVAQPLNDAWEIKRDWLNIDQKNAVKHVLESQDRIAIIKGGAGTGKTALLREAVDAMESAGHQVFTFAPSAEASRGVLAKEGFAATTVAELLVNQNLQQEANGGVWWIDEAGLLGTRTLKQVVDLADHCAARLVFSGDWRQHGSVERGAGMRLLEREVGITPAQVRRIQRQEGQYRDAVAMLARGESADGLEKLDALGWVHEIEEPSERYDRVATRFADGMSAGETVLAIAPTHREADMLTTSIREELVRREMVGKGERKILQLKPLRLTQAEKGEADRVTQGDVLVFHRKTIEFSKGARLNAEDASSLQLKKLSGCFDVYRQSELPIAPGELIRITANGKTKTGNHRLNNGAVYKVRGFDEEGDILLTNGWTIAQDYGHLSAGYVSTSHASQGKTVDRVLIAESALSYPAAGREQFYVSVSRGRKQAEVFTDDKEGLGMAIEKTDSRLSATELLTRQNEARKAAQQNRRQRALQPTIEQELEAVYERA
ncbi:MAG: relaxase domain-containing protein [Pirellulales bacterium]|nr:relaxase domain-containing protein [Pirellulales bacterium]